MKLPSHETLKKLATNRLNTIRKKLYKSTHISDDYVWDCDCSMCMEEKERYHKAHEDIDMIKLIMNEREHIPSKKTNSISVWDCECELCKKEKRYFKSSHTNGYSQYWMNYLKNMKHSRLVREQKERKHDHIVKCKRKKGNS